LGLDVFGLLGLFAGHPMICRRLGTGRLILEPAADTFRLYVNGEGHIFLYEADRELTSGDLLNFWTWVHGIETPNERKEPDVSPKSETGTV